MNTPRSGSLAKAWTEVMTPERTMKVPISEKPKARIASRIVQLFSAFALFHHDGGMQQRRGQISQGMKLAFSTGSQNQKPPQPSS